MKLFNGKSDYVRLDDDVSFQIVRTNPLLTTNTKLMYDGENLYMEAYPAEPILSTMEYVHHRVWKTGLFNRDIRNFLLGCSSAAYTVGQNAQNTIVLDNFDNQFENMYWCGVESINSEIYPQEMGCVAPLYLRKKRPNYFVIFKIDTPANTNLTSNDETYDFTSDVKNRMKIVKSFDLREGTPIGDYIRRYVEQKGFEYDKSIYVNFSSKEIYYYGIDRKSGTLSTKVENFDDQLLRNDNTIMKVDNWITEGFERNNLIFPYIINFEFLFDDNDIKEYKFARYFGMYCNDIDLLECDVKKCEYIKSDDMSLLTVDLDGETSPINDVSCFYYMKDKKKNLHSLEGTISSSVFQINKKVNGDDFMGFELSSVSAYAERLDGKGYASMILEIKKSLTGGDMVIITQGQDSYTFTANSQFSSQEFYNDEFSCNGTLEDIAKALAGVIRNKSELDNITAFNIGSKVIIRAINPGSALNNSITVEFSNTIKNNERIEKNPDNFDGGTDVDGCMFKIDNEDINVYFGDGEDETENNIERYLKSGYGRTNAKIKSIIPYITENKTIDNDYSVIITDSNGTYVNVSKTDQVEIVDKFYARIGLLSFFPVRDFDFDTVSSSYGEYKNMKNELDEINKSISTGEEAIINYIPYWRFANYTGDIVDTEYEYFFENIVPELSTVSKTVPFITKWGYADESKDSCENPYRLNTSKIFEACNFSANTFMQRGDIMEYTHSMPYYVYDRQDATNSTIINEYQYISTVENVQSTFEAWSNYLSNENEDKFDKLFGDTTHTKYENKRFRKKYSRFLNGDNTHRASTLFRGVKFEISEFENKKEVFTGKYNGYKFSFIYVPIEGTKGKNNNTVYFIKNDKFKFVVGILFFFFEADLNTIEFNKAYVYAGCAGFIENKE